MCRSLRGIVYLLHLSRGFCYCVAISQEVQGIGPTSEWLSKEEALKVDGKDRKFIFVFEDFSGPAFDHVAASTNRYSS